MKLVIKAKGNKLIKATHKSTLEITKDNYLTERGDIVKIIRNNPWIGEEIYYRVVVED